jgi:hypothetical protein
MRILQHAFAPMQTAPGRADCCARIERRDADLVLRFGPTSLSFSVHALGSFGAAFAAIRDTFARFAAGYSNATALYAASGAFPDTGVAFFGASGIGKTILLLHLTEYGMRFLGDETAIAKWDTGVMHAQPRLPALREAGLALLPRDDLRNAVAASPNIAHLPSGRYWYALAPQNMLGIAPDATEQPLRVIVEVRARAARARISEVSRDDVLRLVTARSYFKPPTLYELARIRKRLNDVRAFTVHVGDPAGTAALLAEKLQCA